MRRFATLLLTLFFLSGAFPLAASPPDWNGYFQPRFTNDYRETTGFSVRRVKLWLKGPAPGGKRLFYKLQALFRWQEKGSLVLQDAYAEYRFGKGWLRFGQMVPDFSLQRSQPDYRIPLIERAAVIDALIPGAETGARDIGLQLTLAPKNASWQSSVGIFNGNGGNRPANDDRRFMLNHRSRFKITLPGEMIAQVGYSLMYRESAGIALKKIWGNNLLFHGTDVRWGVEGILKTGGWDLQGEYLEAHLEGRVAQGFYLLLNYRLNPQNQITASVEKFTDLNPETGDGPWYIAGFTRFFAGDKAKLLLDARFRQTAGDDRFATTAQLQVFLR